MIVIDMEMPKNCNECNFGYCGQCQVNNEWICDYETNNRPKQCPTVCDIDAIRSEIEALDTDCHVTYAIAVDDVLQIIDKHFRRENDGNGI